MSFASGKHSYGICDISGFRYKLHDMRKTWDGLLVGPDMWDAKHPQLEPKPAPEDPQACLLYTSPSPRDGLLSRMPSSA